MATQVNSSMRQGFDNILIKNVKKNATKGKNSLVDKVLDSLGRKVGLVRSDVWNANLSLRTAKGLNAMNGFDFNRQPRYIYDDMVSGN